MTDTPAAVPPPSPAYGGIPESPAVAPNLAPPSIHQAIWRGAIGAGLVFAGIGGQFAGAGFPSNAPVEMLINFAITITAGIAGVILLVFAFVAWRARSLPLTNGPVSPLAIAAVVAGAIPVIIWLVSVPAMILEGDRMRYQYLAGPAFGTGFLWATAIVMGAISFRSPSRVSRILAVVAVALGFLMIATNIWAAAIYSADLTD